MNFSLKVGGLDESVGKARGAVSVTRGAESAARRIMWSVFFVFLSYLDRNFVKADFLMSKARALDVEKQGKEMFSMLNGTFCAKMSALGENFFYQVSDGTEMVRSVVGPAEELVDCSITVNHMQLKSFLHECRLGRKGERAGGQLETRFARKDEAKLMCQQFKRRSGHSGVVKKDETNEQDQPLKRDKRGFTYPGTLWCGLGNMADDYDQLGDFVETDSCCRTHDHCPQVIHAFSSHYGYTNMKWHSISHCDCDNALKDCLRKVNDTSSRVVGQAFFNVIGVSCFELVYEEQCAERHWYGLCKRYEKFPTAVVKEAAPYDFGSIDVIDELTVTPPRKKDSKNRQEKEKLESAPPSKLPASEEPSLTNVVTAAEDFIKVIATVSTSQSSNVDSDKGETQGSEKKKRKNNGKKKKTTKKQKRKEKLRKRKQKSEVSVRIEEGAAGNKTKEILTLSNFINESYKYNQSNRNRYRADESKYDLGREEEPSNKVMKDEPAMNEESVSATPMVQKQPAKLDSDAPSTSTRTVIGNAYKSKNRRLSKKRRKKNQSQDRNTTKDVSSIDVPASIPITPTTQNTSGSDAKPQPDSRPAVALKVRKDRSKEREDGEGREKMRKVSSASPIVFTGHKDSFAETLNTIPPTGALVPAAERQVCGGRLNVCFSALKRQKANEKRQRNRKRKPVLLFYSDMHPLHNNSTEKTLLSPTSVALSSSSDAVASRLTENSETLNERRLLTTAAPSVAAKRHEHPIRRQRRPRKKQGADLHRAPVASLEASDIEERHVYRSVQVVHDHHMICCHVT